tara:strand:- start:22574 stop:23443 length:870 start_codon:yes stop_codon:yes gene_type:complete
MNTWDDIIKDINRDSKHTKRDDFLFHNIRYWDPLERPIYYFKCYLLFLYNQLDTKTKTVFNNKYNTLFKKEYSIVINKKFIDLDYIQSCLEYEFSQKYIKNCSNILEIGAGYGRTSNFILNFFDKIKTYTIIDFEEIFNKYAFKYLKNNLSKTNFKKIRFIDVKEVKKVQDLKFDLCINIDSMQEMDVGTISNYLKIISKQCKSFYSCNALVKYNIEEFGIKAKQTKKINKALKSGLNQKKSKIFDNKNFNRSLILKGINNYKPNNFKIVKYEINKLMPFYADVIYSKK